MKSDDSGKKSVPPLPPPGVRASTPPAPAEPRVVVNASLLDDVEIHAELPPGVEVWTPGGVRAAKPAIPAKVDVWMPDELKGPKPGAKRTPPPGAFRAQQATLLLPVAKRRHRTKRYAAVSVAALVAALVMLVGVMVWRYFSKNTAPADDPGTFEKNQAR